MNSWSWPWIVSATALTGKAQYCRKCDYLGSRLHLEPVMHFALAVVRAPKVRSTPAQGNALGFADGRCKPRRGVTTGATFECAALSGPVLFPCEPRAVPWAGMSR